MALSLLAETLFAPPVEFAGLQQHHDRENEADRTPHTGDPQCDVSGGSVFVHCKDSTGALMATSATAMMGEWAAVRNAHRVGRPRSSGSPPKWVNVQGIAVEVGLMRTRTGENAKPRVQAFLTELSEPA